MIVLYIILGIIVGVPAYLLLNTVLMLVIRLIAAVTVFLWPEMETTDNPCMNEIKGGDGSFVKGVGKSGKVLSWLYFILIVICFVIALIFRFVWLVLQVFRAWLKFIKSCWNLGSKTKNKTKTKTK